MSATFAIPHVAILFPGVGAQRVGMGRSWYEESRTYRETFEEASDIIRQDVANLCFSAAAPALEREETVHVPLLVTSVAMFRTLMEHVPLVVGFAAGHSLGEYSALCCAGALSLATAVRLVRERGICIRATARSFPGRMIWTMNLGAHEVEAICVHHRAENRKVFISSYNASRQCTVSGEGEAIDAISAELESRGGIVYPLPLAGPYHCPIMEPAAWAMSSILDRYEIGPSRFTVLSNYEATPYSDPADLRRKLSSQLSQPIQWLAIQQRLYEEGVGIAIEVGPKNTLTHLLGQAAPSIRAVAVERYPHPARLADDLRLDEARVGDLIDRSVAVVSTTKSRLTNSELYAKTVVAPYRDLQRLRHGIAEADAERHAARRVLELVDTIMASKLVPLCERRRKMNQVLDGRIPFN